MTPDKTHKTVNYARWFVLLLITIIVVLATGSSAVPATHAQGRGPIYTVTVEGIFTSMTAGYLRRALQVAEASNATALVILLGSEGTVLRDVRPMAAELAEAEVPVVVYVAPGGTESGAGGAFLLSAAHVSAMAPDTSFGSPYALARVDRLLTEQTQNMVFDSVAEQLHTWNSRQNRNTDWIDRAVREGVLITNAQAFDAEPPVVDMVASNTDELLTLLEGRTVQLASGQQVQLHTLGRDVTPITPTLWEEFLLLLANPTILFLCLVVGCVALYAELAHSGVGLFAGIGAVFLLAALVGLLVLPIRWISLFGILLAFGMLAIDLFVPTHGALTLVGVVVMIVSALTLIDTTQAPNVFVAFWAILLVTLMIAAVAAVAIWLIIRLRDTPVTTGQEGLIGRTAEVRERLAPQGLVFIEGALWRAVCNQCEADVGDIVRIVQVHELRLVVQRIEPVSTPQEPSQIQSQSK